MWPSGLTLDMTLTLNFQGQIWNWLYLCQKWSECHKTKSKHIDWTLGLKCDHQIWPWLWPWSWIFKVKYEFLYISTKTGPIATKRKANILIWTLGLKYDQWVWPWPWPWINIWILKVICDLGHLVTKVRCKDLPDNDWGDFRCRCAVDLSSYTCNMPVQFFSKQFRVQTVLCFSHMSSCGRLFQIPEGSVTVLGIMGKNNMVDQVTGDLSLLS